MIAIIEGCDAELVATPAVNCTATASSAYASATASPGRNRWRGTLRNASSTAAERTRPDSRRASTIRLRARSASTAASLLRGATLDNSAVPFRRGSAVAHGDQVVGVDHLAAQLRREVLGAAAD